MLNDNAYLMGTHFELACIMYRKSYCTAPGVGISKMLKFYILFFLCDGKALSSELLCMRTALFSAEVMIGLLKLPQRLDLIRPLIIYRKSEKK